MIYFKICKCIKENINTELKGSIEDLETILELETITLIKIGYTDDNDNISDKRSSMYKTENPNIIHYKNIEGGDKIDERKIHRKFKDKLFRGREWFILDSDIFNFMLSINSIDDLRGLTKDIDLGTRSSGYKKIHEDKIIKFIIKELYPDLGDYTILNKEYSDIYSSLVKELQWIKPEDLEYYIQSRYSINLDLTNIYSDSSIEDNISEYIDKFNSIRNVTEKLKLLVEFCESGDRTEREINNFLELIPGKYKDYYTLLGPDRIRANSYHESELKQEWIRIKSNESISDSLITEIYNTFEVGKRYTMPDIKNSLKDLYSRFGYDKTAKASDLEDYFYMKKVYITSIKKNGFEIVAKK